MRRRDLLRAAGLSVVPTVSGCASSGGDGAGTPLDPGQVTTTGGSAVEFLVGQIAIAPDGDGPDAFYRVRNPGDADAVVRIETVLTIEEGGTYSAFALVSIPAGEEVTVRYRIVDFEALTEAESRRVRQGDGLTVEVFVNGERRADV